KEALFLRDDHINALASRELSGSNFLKLITERLINPPYNFLDGPAERIVDFVTRLNDQRLLSLEEYLSYPPPYITYSPHGTSSTSSTNAVGNPPDEVTLWEDFLENVNEYMFDQEQKFQKPIFNTKFKATFEEIVRNAFNVNICMILNEVITDCEFAMRGVQGTGSPNFACHKKDDDKLIMAIEIKRYHILLGIKPDQTLPEFYKEDAKARMVIQQIYNYLSENQLKYGALSTYDNNWFVKREHKRLYISKSPSLDSTRPPILKSYAYLARLAKRDHYSLHSSIIPQIDDSQYNLRKRSHDDSDDDRYDSNSNPQLSRSQRSSFNRSSSGTSGSQQSSSKQSASKQSSSNTSGNKT
ncbi:11770_t:CDS:2, partial [Funneliformis mosseae]